MILIYADFITERQIFTFDFVFKRNGNKYEIVNDFERFLSFEGLKFNYSDKEIENVLQFPPAKILFEEEVNQTIESEISIFEWRQIEILSFDQIPDPFASIFYFLSDYTNYLTKKRDDHNRAISTESLAAKLNWLEKCKADEWTLAVLDCLNKKEFGLKLPNRAVNLIPTFDIDNTFAYKLKDGFRGKLSVFKDYLKLNKNRIAERKLVLSGEIKDPYDTFDYILSLQEKGLNPQLFYLLGDFTKFDRNISAKDPRHKRFISKLSKSLPIGLHPSYKSNTSKTQLKEEKNRLEVILNSDVLKSRQHFLKLQIPNTYRNLIALGFEHDYSTGYADTVGFRLGTSKSVPFFDLLRNEITTLDLHPFAYMDGTLNQYLGLTTKVAKQKIEVLYEEVEKYGGDFISIWHNETLGNYGIWKDWRTVHEFMVDLHLRRNEEA